MTDYTDFEIRYDCQVQFQYSFDGKQKQYYPIITFLQASETQIDLSCFQNYPLISFQECRLERCDLIIDRIRDLNFRRCRLAAISIITDSFSGTLGFAACSLSLVYLEVTTSPKILAIINSLLVGLQQSRLIGFDNLHTLAIIDTGLDYLDLDPMLSQLNLEQLILTEIQEIIPIRFTVPDELVCLRIKHSHIHQFIELSPVSHLKILYLEAVEIDNVSQHMLKSLENASQLEEVSISKSSIEYIPYLDLRSLRKLDVGGEIKLSDKMIAKLRLQDVVYTRL